MEKRIVLLGNEAAALAEYFGAIETAKRELSVAAGMVLAREGITVGTVEGVADNEMVVTVPDAPDDSTAPADVTVSSD